MILPRPNRFIGARESAAASSLYFVSWAIMTWPAALHFHTHYWMDEGDGLQMIWNLWHASVHPMELVHSTCALFPDGFSPLLHSYHPLTSWMVAWLPFDLVVRFNLAILLTFVGSGLSAYWLCRYLGASRWGAWVGGFAFTFTGYHWAHNQGHLNLISTQFVPLFCLAWLQYLLRPDFKRAVFAAGSLLAVLLCDHYLAAYCILFALLVWLVRPRAPRRLWRFLLLASLSSGVVVAFMLDAYLRGAYVGAHPPQNAPLDLLSLFVPGGHWRFGGLTEPVWTQFRGNVHENSVYLGLSLWLSILIVRRRSIWWLVLGVFALFALGEQLIVLGRETPIPLPYKLLSSAIPPLNYGGAPVRMVVMVALAAAVLASHSFSRMGRVGVLLATLLFLELLPSPIAMHRRPHADWAAALAQDDGEGALLDGTVEPHDALYEQIRHRRPIFAARPARLPASALDRDVEFAMLRARADWSTLREIGFGYLHTDRQRADLEVIHSDEHGWLYRLPED